MNFNIDRQSIQKTILGAIVTTGIALTPVLVPQTAQAQRIVSTSPGINSENVPPDTSVSGLFEANGQTTIDPKSVRLFVNNQDVTSNSTITSSFFSYRPTQALPTGKNEVRVQYKNASGQNRVATWNFTVQRPQANLNITSVSHNASSKPLGPGSTFLATINGTPGAKASVLLIENNDTVRELPAQEVSSGVYVATLNLQASDQVNQGVIVGRLQRQNNTIYDAAPQAANFSSNAQTAAVPEVQGESTTGTNTAATSSNANALRPVFLNYQNGDQISSRGFTLEGQTKPSAKVRVKVTSATSVLGGLVQVGGNTLVEQEVTADSQGRFQIQIPASSVATSGTRYNVEASASAGNQTSQTTQITLTQK